MAAFFQLQALDGITDLLKGLAMNVNAVFLAVETVWGKKVSGVALQSREKWELPYTVYENEWAALKEAAGSPRNFKGYSVLADQVQSVLQQCSYGTGTQRWL